MTSKSRKSLSVVWITCEKCQSTIPQKDSTDHISECPPPEIDWKNNYIRNLTLHSTAEIYVADQELPKNISARHTHDMVFMSHSALQHCQIAIGDRVMIKYHDGAIVKTAWPTYDKSLTSVCLTKSTIDINKINGPIKVKKFTHMLNSAKEIMIEYTSKQSRPKFTQDLQVMIKNLNEHKAFAVNNKIFIPYYGKNLILKIIRIIGDRESASNDLTAEFERIRIDDTEYEFYEALYTTKWTLIDEKENENNNLEKENENNNLVKKNYPRLEDIGGYQKLIESIIKVMTPALSKFDKVWKGIEDCKGILLYGSEGVGKTTIASALLAHFNVNIFEMNDVFKKNSTESSLKEIFAEAKSQSPSIIFIDDIDDFCPKKSSSTSNDDKRLLKVLINEIDNLMNSDCSTMILATSSKPDSIDQKLKSFGKIDEMFEIPAPTPKIRFDILKKLLTNVPNNINDDDIEELSSTTHGFVASDLCLLCRKAKIHARERYELAQDNNDDIDVEFSITNADFKFARDKVNPSAMTEVLVEVVNVRWTDIGGYDKLKLELKQSVEWPLKYGDKFDYYGIKQPKGFLMFGPPGCSKTMIAKALSTETKLNFISIKGSEIFSKWVGDSEKNVRDLFRKAKQVAPSIIFIDEIDTIGGERSSGSSSTGSQVQDRVLTQFLTELDGVQSLENVILVAATNRPDRMDKALIRSGRFDSKIYVPLPDDKTRLEIFKIKFKRMPIGDDVDIEELVNKTNGYSGAEIQNICNKAAIKALHRNLENSSGNNTETSCIIKNDFEAALADVIPVTPKSLIKIYENYLSNDKNKV